VGGGGGGGGGGRRDDGTTEGNGFIVQCNDFISAAGLCFV